MSQCTGSVADTVTFCDDDLNSALDYGGCNAVTDIDSNEHASEMDDSSNDTKKMKEIR
jgi:hypothetical protein